MFESEFDEPSLLMRCPRCFQPLSPLKVRCGQCGRTDYRRVLKTVGDLLLGSTALVGAIAIVFLAFQSQGA
jgi:hypothetical protein